ncbi:MAG: hypothetical protein J6T26_05355 [Firmicutes bacterium]|nr:hypothetical protein [Bacillota bacterium]
MLAAIAVEQEGLDSVIPETLAEAGFLYIMELDDGEIKAALPVVGVGQILQSVGENGCRALIAGQIDEATRQALRDIDVLCYEGYLYRAGQVRRLLYTGVLPCV